MLNSESPKSKKKKKDKEALPANQGLAMDVNVTLLILWEGDYIKLHSLVLHRFMIQNKVIV